MDLPTQFLLLGSLCVSAAVMARVLWVLSLWVHSLEVAPEATKE